ncbi:branched-chain amino acid aminotransferase [Pyrenochaeta sp. MPI-SDFR-AT-0127]|nr:branched-chain amino acid aminotransferase [Pyrenochaeta sp. MPI-SDFR-AT-0127]
MAPGILTIENPHKGDLVSSEPARLDAAKLRITKTLQASQVPLAGDLAFGKHTTDHMLQVEWSLQQGWHAPHILPYQPISLDPAACVFHYGFECFEGMKAYRDAKGAVRLFRPEMNLNRLKRSAERIALPGFDCGELLKLIARFVNLEERFISGKPGYSLYLRPVIIGTNRGLGVAGPTSALLYIIASPVGAYYSSGFKSLLLEATSSDVATRAWPGGAGNQKVGGNYAPGIVPEKAAQRRGFHQLLWLFGENDLITEAGTMNVFVVLRTEREGCFELITPPLDGMILPGVTRDCVLSLARERLLPLGWLVHERAICMSELASAAQTGKLAEVFGTGTAAIISPIRAIKWQGRLLYCGLAPHENAGPVTTLMKDWIEARQHGTEDHAWSTLIDQILT